MSVEGFRDEGGLFGIAGHPRAVTVVCAGLRELHHRGERSAGLVASDGYVLRSARGLVNELFPGATLRGLGGGLVLGQVFGADAPPDGPFLARVRGGSVAIALSGHVANATRLRRDLDDRGAVQTSTADAELLAHLVAQSPQKTVVNRLVDALWRAEGGFSVVAITEDRLIAVRDPRGFRPLVFGRLDGAALFASEDGAVRAIGGEVVRDVEPGEMIIVDPGGVRSVAPFPRRPRASCVQELVSIARPDGRALDVPVHGVRVALGERLWREQPCAKAEIIVPWPDGGAAAASGAALIAGIPSIPALFRPPGADDGLADGTRIRLAAIPSIVEGHIIALVAPSLATGEGLRQGVAALRAAGAVEVHVRLASPEVKSGCPYGVRGPAADVTTAIGADSTAWLPLPAFREVLAQHHASGACEGCLSGEWPVPPDVDGQLPLFEASAV